MKHICLAVFFFSLSAFSAPLNLALNWKPEPQFGGFYQAEVDGLFGKENLEVKILPGGSGTPTIQMLTNGKVDAAVVSAEEVLISNEKNPNSQVVAIFAAFQINPQIIMVHESRGIKSLKKLFQSPGTIAMQSGLTYAQFLKQKFAPVKAKIVPYQGGISYLQKGPTTAQQGFLTSEPILAENAGIKVTTFLVADEGFNPYTTVLAVRKKDFLAEPKKYNSLATAVRNGWNRYLTSPDRGNSMMAGLNKGMDIETFKKSSIAQRPLIETNITGSMTEKRWSDLIDQLVKLKVLKKKLKATDQFQNM